MGRLQKKGRKGAVTNYVSRSQALRRLQIKLPDFRRLCILKGIYPREPKNKKKVGRGNAAPNTYYWVKDIAFLHHEPLLAKFREYKVFARKLRKALGKHQTSIAESLQKSKPTYTLDHIIKERYPSFVDAVRDLDDALCLLFLFARMPHGNGIKAETVQRCERLCAEFQHYVILTGSLQKVFLSIKGIYYQASILGQTVTWIVPYPLGQSIPSDVDFKVMLSFLELYETLVGFVNFKLYLDENLAYPPKIDQALYAKGAGLAAYNVESIASRQQQQQQQQALTDAPKATGAKPDAEQQKRLKSLQGKIAQIVKHDNSVQKDDVAPAATNDDLLLDEFPANKEESAADGDSSDPNVPVTSSSKLFAGLVFFLNREVPRDSLEFVVKAFGGRVGYQDSEVSGIKEDSPEVTHHIVDRPVVSSKLASRDYIQPQWVYDCINARRLLPVDLYAIGAKLPPHLSPFMSAREVDYDPSAVVPQGGDAEEEEEEEEDDEEVEEQKQDDDKMDVSTKQDEEDDDEEEEEEEEEHDDEEEEDDDEEEDEEEKEIAKKPTVQKKPTFASSAATEEEIQYQEELAAEAAGLSYSEYKKQQAKKKRSAPATPTLSVSEKKKHKTLSEADEEKEMAKIMMTKRDKHLYSKIQKGKELRTKQADRLRTKKAKLDKAAKTAGKASK